MNTNQARPVKTTLTSIRIVQLVKSRNGASLTEIAEELELAKSTVHNHIATLVQEELLVQRGRQYHIGLGFLEFGEYARNRSELYTPAKVQVYRVAESTNEEAHFAVEENGFMFSLEYVMGDANPMNPEVGSQFLKVGNKFHMHNSAPGKAVLAEFSAEEVERLIELRGLPATTENTLTDETELIEELEEIREQGYATNDEELRRGFRSIASSVNHPDGTVIGALSIGGPAYRFELTNPVVERSINTLLDAIGHVEDEIAELEV